MVEITYIECLGIWYSLDLPSQPVTVAKKATCDPVGDEPASWVKGLDPRYSFWLYLFHLDVPGS